MMRCLVPRRVWRKKFSGVVVRVTPLTWLRLENLVAEDRGSKFAILIEKTDALEAAAVEMAVLGQNRSDHLVLFGCKLQKQRIWVAVEVGIRNTCRAWSRRLKAHDSRSHDVAPVEREPLDDRRHLVSDQLCDTHDPILVVGVPNPHDDAPS